MRQAVLLVLIVIPGVIGALGFGLFALQDYAILKVFYARFEQVAQQSPTITALAFAEANQSIYRINVFADGVWTLLCAIYAAIGVHALCLLPPKSRM
jgi:hypothetical protein